MKERYAPEVCNVLSFASSTLLAPLIVSFLEEVDFQGVYELSEQRQERLVIIVQVKMDLKQDRYCVFL